MYLFMALNANILNVSFYPFLQIASKINSSRNSDIWPAFEHFMRQNWCIISSYSRRVWKFARIRDCACVDADKID